MEHIEIYYGLFFLNLTLNLICVIILLHKSLLKQTLNRYLLLQMIFEFTYSLVYLVEFLLFLDDYSLKHFSTVSCWLHTYMVESLNTLCVCLALLFTIGHLYIMMRPEKAATFCIIRKPVRVSAIVYLIILIMQSPSFFLVPRFYTENQVCNMIDSLDHKMFLESIFMTVPPITFTLMVQLTLWCMIFRRKCSTSKQSIAYLHAPVSINTTSDSSEAAQSPNENTTINSNNNNNSNHENKKLKKNGRTSNNSTTVDMYVCNQYALSSFQPPLSMFMCLNFMSLIHYIYNIIQLGETFALFVTGLAYTLKMDPVHYLVINAICMLVRSSYLFVYFAFHNEFRLCVLSKFQTIVVSVRRHSSNLSDRARYTPASGSLTESLEIILDDVNQHPPPAANV